GFRLPWRALLVTLPGPDHGPVGTYPNDPPTALHAAYRRGIGNVSRVGLVVLGRDAVDRLSRLVEHFGGLGRLLRGADRGDLGDRAHELADERAQVDGLGAHVVLHVGPRVTQFVLVLGDVGGALLGQLGGLAPGDLLDDDQALILELGQRGVDRAGAGTPDVVTALADLLDELVAVHGPLGEQQQDGRADVTAPAASAATAAASEVRTETGAEAGTGPELGTEAVPGTAPMSAAIELARAASPGAAGVMVGVEVLVLHVFSLLGLVVAYVVDDISTMHPKP